MYSVDGELVQRQSRSNGLIETAFERVGDDWVQCVFNGNGRVWQFDPNGEPDGYIEYAMGDEVR